MNVSIAGTGLITPLGRSVEQTWNALLAGKYIEDHARSTGEWNNNEPRVIQMARLVARQALQQAAWPDFDAIVVGTSKGSVESWLAGAVDPAGLADIASHLSTRNQPRLTLSGACASGLMALIRAAMLIQSNHARRVLVVAAEAGVHPLFIGSFTRLGVLPKPGIGCRPFDHARDGFLMSEAAAAVCLEPSGDPGRIAVDRFALAGDAAHLTAADPDGKTLRHLLTRVAAESTVDLVQAHGTGTILNDPVELSAIESSVTGSPALYSHKGALGHSLGAAGLVAVVLSALAHQRGIVPPNVRTTSPLRATRVTLEQGAQRRNINRSIVLASGFGGASAAVALTTI